MSPPLQEPGVGCDEGGVARTQLATEWFEGAVAIMRRAVARLAAAEKAAAAEVEAEELSGSGRLDERQKPRRGKR